MGMFDSVIVTCPNQPCGEKFKIQTKSGKCQLRIYAEHALPIEIAVELDGNDEWSCPYCDQRVILHRVHRTESIFGKRGEINEHTGNVMTPDHPKWREFCERLTGPEGCDFRKLENGRTVWSCAGGTDKTHATAILQKMGFLETEVADSLKFFERHGGYCDCEILFNVEAEGEGRDS